VYLKYTCIARRTGDSIAQKNMIKRHFILSLCIAFCYCTNSFAQQHKKMDSSMVNANIKLNGDSISGRLQSEKKAVRSSSDSVKNTLSWQYKKLVKGVKNIHKDSININKSHFEKSPLSILGKNKRDTFPSRKDSMLSSIKKLPENMKGKLDTGLIRFKESLTGGFTKTAGIKPDSIALSMLPAISFNGMLRTKPFIKLNSGWLSYNFNYRSNVDTPFTEKNIQQHNSYGYLNLSVAGLPFNVNYLIRRSNSAYFRDINDVQIQFDALQFRNSLLGQISTQMQNSLHMPGDSLLKLKINGYLDKYKNLNGWLNDPFTLQKLMEYKEMISVPQISYTPGLPDSVNAKKAADATATATTFIKEYENKKRESALLKNTVDSLEHSYKILKDALSLQKKNIGTLTSSAGGCVNHKNIDSLIPSKYRWLFNIRKFGLGRNQLNYSELTSKNMSLTGVNFEYNSWYYVAFAAGTVDYRFRDFAVGNTRRVPQYMTMFRLGLGQIERTHIIASLYRGRKQLFAASGNSTGITAINITGMAVEGKWRINPNSYVSGEAAESLSPDFRKIPVTTSKFSLSDKSNKALSLKYYLYIPKTFSRIEAAYKFTGANFQSFSSFQTNSEATSWSVKADQYLLKRKLKIALAVKKNEFSNPYITQAYTNNTIFKSVQLTYRAKHFPVISAGFAPMSQVTIVDSQLVENIFYSLNVSASHNYKIGIRKATTSFIYNKFYNNYQDTSFLYYKAENIFFTQSIAFDSYVMNLSLSNSSNSSFNLTVFDAGVLFNIKKAGMLGFGVKVNEFSRQEAKTGLYGTLQLNVKKIGLFSMQYNNGFIPGRHTQLVKNEMMNVGFTKSF